MSPEAGNPEGSTDAADESLKSEEEDNGASTSAGGGGTTAADDSQGGGGGGEASPNNKSGGPNHNTSAMSVSSGGGERAANTTEPALSTSVKDKSAGLTVDDLEDVLLELNKYEKQVRPMTLRTTYLGNQQMSVF